MKDEFGGTILEDVQEKDEFGGTVIGFAPSEDQTGWETETPIEKSAREFEADKQFTPPTAPGFFRSLGRQFIQPFKAAGMGVGTMVLDDDTLKSHLLSEWAKSEQEQSPTGLGTLGGTIGGIGGSIANYIMASSRGGKLVGPALAFGSMGAYDAFTRAGIQALNEGKDPDTALQIAKAMAPVGAAAGAATTLAFPSVGAKTLTGAAKQGVAPAIASAAGLLGQNVAQRGLGLETPVTEGVAEAAGTMLALPPGAHLAALSLRGVPSMIPRRAPLVVPPAIMRPRVPVTRPVETVPPPVTAPAAPAPAAAPPERMNFTPKGPVEVLEVNQQKGTALVKLWGVPDAQPEVMDLRDIINRPLRVGELNAIQERIAKKVSVRQTPEAGQEVGGQVRNPEEPAQAQPETAVSGEGVPLGDVELNERQRLIRERDRIGKQLLEKPDDPILLAEEAKVYAMMGEFDRAQESLDLANRFAQEKYPKGYGAKAISSAEKILKGRKRVTEEADATERLALDEGEQLGMDSVVEDAMPTGEPFAPGVLATRDNQGRIVWNRAELRRLREMPEGKRKRVIKAVGNEEWIHSFVNNATAKRWYDNMTALERAAARRRYSGSWKGQVPGEAPGTVRILTDAEIGHESIRARMQQLLGVEPTEVAMGKGWEWMTSKALLELERIVFNIRRMLGTKASQRQMEILDGIDVRIQAGKQRLGIEPKPAAMTKQEQEKTPEAESAKSVGWTFDAYWDLPDGRRLMQFTKRQDPNNPAYGATFYLPDGATPQEIRARAFEKEAEFGAEPKPASFMKPQEETQRPSAAFWITPTAEFRPVGKEQHFRYAVQASSWLPKRDNKPYTNMYKNGFVRGTYDAPTKTVTLDTGGLPIAPGLLRQIRDMAIEGGYTVVHETPGAPRPTRMIYDASAEAVPSARRKVKPGEGQEELGLFGTPPAPAPQKPGQQELLPPEPPKPAVQEKPFFPTRKQVQVELPAQKPAQKPGQQELFTPAAAEKPLFPKRGPEQPELPTQAQPTEGRLPFGYVPEAGPRPADFEADARAFIAEGGKVSFDTFVKTMRDKYGRMKIQPGHVQQLFRDAVWPTLLRLPGKRIKELVKNLRVSEGGMRTGVGAQRTMIDAIGKKEIPDAPPERVVQRLLTLGERVPFKGRTPSASLAGLSYGQRLRQKAIAAIGEKLLNQANLVEADLARKSVTPAEIAFYHDRVTFEPAYRPVSLEEQTNPNLGRILTDEGRVSGQNESVTRRLTAVLNTDTGAVHLLSTYRTGEKIAYIMEPGGMKARPNVPLKDFLARTGKQGQRLYRVMDSYLLDEPVQNFSQRFESVKEYRNTFKREAAGLAREAEMASPVEERAVPEEGELPSVLRTGQPITDQEARRVYDFFASGEPKEPADVQAKLESLFPENRGVDPETNLPRDLSASQIAFVDALGKLVDQEMKASKTAHPVALSRVLDTIYENIIEEGRTRSDFIKQVLARVPTEAEPVPTEAQRAAIARRPITIPPRPGVSRELTMLNRLPPTVIRGEPLRKSVPIPPPSGEVPARLLPEAMPSFRERKAAIEAGSRRAMLERTRKAQSQFQSYLDWLEKREPLQPTPGQEAGPARPELRAQEMGTPPRFAPEIETPVTDELSRLRVQRQALQKSIASAQEELASAPARKRFDIRERLSDLNRKLIPINDKISELTGEQVAQGPSQGELGLPPAARRKIKASEAQLELGFKALPPPSQPPKQLTTTEQRPAEKTPGQLRLVWDAASKWEAAQKAIAKNEGARKWQAEQLRLDNLRRMSPEQREELDMLEQRQLMRQAYSKSNEAALMEDGKKFANREGLTAKEEKAIRSQADKIWTDLEAKVSEYEKAFVQFEKLPTSTLDKSLTAIEKQARELYDKWNDLSDEIYFLGRDTELHPPTGEKGWALQDSLERWLKNKTEMLAGFKPENYNNVEALVKEAKSIWEQFSEKSLEFERRAAEETSQDILNKLEDESAALYAKWGDYSERLKELGYELTAGRDNLTKEQMDKWFFGPSPKEPPPPDIEHPLGPGRFELGGGSEAEPPLEDWQQPPDWWKGEDGGAPAAFMKPAAKSTYNVVKDVIQGAGRTYSEWLIDRIRRAGGPISRQAADVFNRIVSREQELYGSLTPSLDPARREAGKLGKATTWLHQISPITSRTGVANVVGSIEGKTPVPSFAQRLVDLAQQANIEIGQLLQAVVPGFKATGAFQRNLTAFGYDIIREGKGKVWRDWTDGLAQANSLNPQVVRGFFRKWKAILDEPMPDAARVEKINQDFARVFPEVVTHVKLGEVGGGRWEAVVHADLFNYLENAARRASHVRSFREYFPNDAMGRRRFNAMQRAARSELGTDYQADWDAILKGLHGHPTDSYTQFGAIRPGTPLGEAFRFVNNTVGNLMARMVLTGQMFVQPGENMAGSTPVFLGYKNYVRGLAKVKQLYPQLEQAGAVNRVMYDMTFDPTAPVRSSFRIAGNTISRAFMENALNELQEAAAAATAKVVTERIQAGTLSSWEQRQLPLTFKAMGFTNPQVQAIMRGDVELLGQFQRKAAAFLSGGNKSIVQGSRIGANRLFNSLFRFQTYPMMKLNQFRRVAGNLGEAFKSGTPAQKLAASEQFARFMFGTTLQGALTVAITALAYEGLHGAGIRAQEAKDEPFKFLMESALSTMAGPLYLVYRGARSSGISGVGEQAARTLFPYAIVKELTDTAQGAGQYKDLSLFDRIGKFVQQRLPGTRAIRLALSAVGLSDRDAKLESSITAFYRWRRDKLGFREERNEEKEDTRHQFRIHMKRAVEALKRGRTEQFSEEIGNAARQPGLKPGSVTQSLRARKLLKKPDGSELSPEDMDALRNHIGDDSVDMLIHYDGMLDAIAEVLGEVP